MRVSARSCRLACVLSLGVGLLSCAKVTPRRSAMLSDGDPPVTATYRVIDEEAEPFPPEPLPGMTSLQPSAMAEDLEPRELTRSKRSVRVQTVPLPEEPQPPRLPMR